MSTTITEAPSCPDCDARIEVASDVHPSEIVECPECMAELEVLSIEPLTLVVAPEVEEDWGE